MQHVSARSIVRKAGQHHPCGRSRDRGGHDVRPRAGQDQQWPHCVWPVPEHRVGASRRDSPGVDRHVPRAHRWGDVGAGAALPTDRAPPGDRAGLCHRARHGSKRPHRNRGRGLGAGSRLHLWIHRCHAAWPREAFPGPRPWARAIGADAGPRRRGAEVPPRAPGRLTPGAPNPEVRDLRCGAGESQGSPVSGKIEVSNGWLLISLRFGGEDQTTRVLLIGDDAKLVPLLERGLAYEDFDVYTAGDGESGLTLAESHRPHVVLLDIAMPHPDGFEVCRRLRLVHDVPIIMLTARDDVADKVTALNLGADDYVPKPFAFEELVARIRAVLRRHPASEEPLEYGDLILEPRTREVRRDGHTIELTPREYELLLL